VEAITVEVMNEVAVLVLCEAVLVLVLVPVVVDEREVVVVVDVVAESEEVLDVVEEDEDSDVDDEDDVRLVVSLVNEEVVKDVPVSVVEVTEVVVVAEGVLLVAVLGIPLGLTLIS